MKTLETCQTIAGVKAWIRSIHENYDVPDYEEIDKALHQAALIGARQSMTEIATQLADNISHKILLCVIDEALKTNTSVAEVVSQCGCTGPLPGHTECPCKEKYSALHQAKLEGSRLAIEAAALICEGKSGPDAMGNTFINELGGEHAASAIRALDAAAIVKKGM